MNAASDASKRKKTGKSREGPANLFALPHELFTEIFVLFATGEDGDPLNTAKSRVHRAATLRALCKPQSKWMLSYMCEQALVVMHEKRANLRAQRAHAGMRFLHSNHAREDAFTRLFFSTMVQNENAKAALGGLELLVERYAIDETHLAATHDRVRQITDPILATMHALIPYPPDANAHTE